MCSITDKHVRSARNSSEQCTIHFKGIPSILTSNSNEFAFCNNLRYRQEKCNKQYFHLAGKTNSVEDLGEPMSTSFRQNRPTQGHVVSSSQRTHKRAAAPCALHSRVSGIVSGLSEDSRMHGELRTDGPDGFAVRTKYRLRFQCGQFSSTHGTYKMSAMQAIPTCQ